MLLASVAATEWFHQTASKFITTGRVKKEQARHSTLLDHGARPDIGPFTDDDNTVSNIVLAGRIIVFGQPPFVKNGDIGTDMRVFIDDGPPNSGIAANTDPAFPGDMFRIKIGAQKQAAFDFGAGFNAGSKTNHGVLNDGAFNQAAVTNNLIGDVAFQYQGPGQVTLAGIDGLRGMK